MLNRRSLLLSSAAASAAVAAPSAQADAAPARPSDSAETGMERALTLRERWTWLTENVADPAHWIERTGLFHYRKTVPDGFAFILCDAATQQKRPAFDQARLASALAKATGQPVHPLRLPFESFEFAEGMQAIRFRVGQEGWTCRLPGYDLARDDTPRHGQPKGFGVVRDLTVLADNTPHASPDGRWEALVDNHNLLVRPRRGGAPVLLSTDGSEGNFYDPQSILWAPDSRKLMALRVEPGYRREVHRVQSCPPNQLQPELKTQLYPKPGDRIDHDHPVLFHLEPAHQIALPDALFPTPYQLTRVAWRPDSASFAFEHIQRGHQHCGILQVDAQTGAVSACVDERQPTFVNTWRQFRHDVGGQGREIIWMSERDGWNHLYLFDARTGRVKNPITHGAWVVREVLHVDEAARQIYFAACGREPGQDPYFPHAYRVDFTGRNLVRLTTEPAWHDVAISPNLDYYVDTYSRVDLPTVSELRRLSDRSLVATLEKGDVSRLIAAGWKPPDVFVAKGRDGRTDIWGVIVRPTDFDPAKRYPVLENIYAGPHNAFTPKTFWPFGAWSLSNDALAGMQAMAEAGFIVVEMDGMGTLNRSKAFHDVCWKNIRDAGFPDRIAWHRAAGAKYPQMDLTRVGLYGGSAGGQNTLGGLLFHGDFYKAGVSYAGCHDNRMDKIGWNEQWMGWPVDESYARSSNVDNAHLLKGDLLLVVGEQDTNVDPSSTLQVANALIRADKPFDLLVIPGGDHTVGREVGPITYMLRKQIEFFWRHLANS
jgi:dipeptidyl aminopeptidase/acylaminoacyl peptidase